MVHDDGRTDRRPGAGRGTRAAKERFEQQGERTELVRRDLAVEPDGATGKPVRLPLVDCVHAASPEEELEPARVSDLLLAQEAGP
jgi:hypothetical protein